jgi:CheY-like chemotaxis protein
MQILVADDEADLRETLKILLEIRGHTVHLAVNGEEAVHVAMQHRPDVILMDVRMPILDGIAATRLLRARPDTASIPIICMSGYLGEDYSLSDALEVGFVDVLPKPMEWKKLKDLIERIGAAFTRE